MNIGLKTAMIQDLEGLGYEVSNYDKKIIDTIVTLYQQIKDCDKELKNEGLLMEVDGKIKSNPRLDVKLKLLSTLKSYLTMLPLYPSPPLGRHKPIAGELSHADVPQCASVSLHRRRGNLIPYCLCLTQGT